MSYLNSVVSFTKIALQRGLPVDIIHMILEKTNRQIKTCNFCDDLFSTLWYERTCCECKHNSVNCCYICFDNDLLNDIGIRCPKCNLWHCGICMNNNENVIQDTGDLGYGRFDCKCGRTLSVYYKLYPVDPYPSDIIKRFI